jgi:HEAT repeat protein
MTPESIPMSKALADIFDKEKPLTSTELAQLSQIYGEDLNQFTKLWPNADTSRREQIMTNLIHLSETDLKLDFCNIFIFCLNDPNENIRIHAVRGLEIEEEENVVTPLLKTLNQDSSAEVRTAVATTLGKFALLAELGKLTTVNTENVYDALLRILDNKQEVSEVKRRALESIAPFNTPRIKELINAAYHSNDPEYKASALYAMGRNCDPFWFEILLSELGNTVPLMRYEAARALGELCDEEAVPKLGILTMDEDTEVQEAAIKAIGEIGGPHARQTLSELTKSQDLRISMAAKSAIEELTFFEDPISIE